MKKTNRTSDIRRGGGAGLIFRLAFGNVRGTGKRAVLTALGVTLSTAIISFMYTMTFTLIRVFRDYLWKLEEERGASGAGGPFSGGDAVMWNAVFGERESSPADPFIASQWMFYLILTVVCVALACIMISFAFNSAFEGRVKLFGTLTSLGISPGQRAAMIAVESAVYGVVGIVFGLLPGAALGGKFGRETLLMLEKEGYEGFSAGAPIAADLVISALIAMAAVMAASTAPMRRLRRISVMDSVFGRVELNVSLRAGIMEKISERLFGFTGRLAGMNFDNYRRSYRYIMFVLSAGSTLFMTAYCMSTYLLWRNGNYLDLAVGIFRIGFTEGTESLFAMIGVLIVTALVCGSMGMVTAIDARVRDLAILRSVGMGNRELSLMMFAESVYIVLYSAFFGFVFSFAADYVLWTFMMNVDVGEAILPFVYPVGGFFCCIVVFAAVGAAYAAYASWRTRHADIISVIKTA